MTMTVDPFTNIRSLVQTPAHLMRSYVIAQPLTSHFRVGTCAEVDCPNRAGGWRMAYDLTDPDRAAAARWIRDHSGRRYTHELLDGGRKIVFTFPAGQDCFETHRVPLERDPIMVVRGGDFRGNPTRERSVHTSADSFIDQWSTDLDRLNTVHERG